MKTASPLPFPRAVLSRWLVFTWVLLCSVPATAADTSGYRYEDGQILLSLKPRTPQQMAAFYTGRGFSASMIELLKRQCFITVFIKNKGRDILWLDLAQWQFANPDGPLTRAHRDQWKRTWQKMHIPLAHQSTFRWTLLPEILDFQPDEREGGNLVLPRLGKPLRIIAHFPTGADRSGPPLTLDIGPLECAVDP